MNTFLTGLGVGIALGVLFAPKPGRQTRRYLGDVANDSVHYLKRQGQELRDSAMDVVERGKSMVNRQVEKFAVAAQATGQEVYQR